ncbi:hypothetical protein D3C78_1063260 [compost metagenome]
MTLGPELADSSSLLALRFRGTAGLSVVLRDVLPALRPLALVLTEGVSPSNEVLDARDCTRTLSTIMQANLFTFSINCPSDAVPLDISFKRRSHCPVISGEVNSSIPAPRISSMAVRPFCVMAIFLPCISMYPTFFSRSIVAARVAGVPSPESFIASRSSSSSICLPALSIARSSVPSV